MPSNFFKIFNLTHVNHKPGEIWYDSLDVPHCNCRICGEEMIVTKGKSLGDMDRLILKDLSQTSTSKQDDAKNEMASSHRILIPPNSGELECKYCGGNLGIVRPEVYLGNKVLCQCYICGEREYKIIGE